MPLNFEGILAFSAVFAAFKFWSIREKISSSPPPGQLDDRRGWSPSTVTDLVRLKGKLWVDGRKTKEDGRSL